MVLLRGARGWTIASALVFAACGGDDDDGGASTGGASLEDGPEPTTMPSSVDDGGSTLPQGSSDDASASSSDGATAADGSDGSSGASGSDSGSGSGSSGASGDTTMGVGTDDGGVAVDSCDKCPAPQLCVELTEHGGPADDGAVPTVSYTCHDLPAMCKALADCECAGHLCPPKENGIVSECSSDGEMLYCDVAFP